MIYIMLTINLIISSIILIIISKKDECKCENKEIKIEPIISKKKVTKISPKYHSPYHENERIQTQHEKDGWHT